MHNTQWVPGHFHFYLLLGLLPMVFGFMYFTALRGRSLVEGTLDRFAFQAFVVGGLGVVGTFLAAGYAGVPRRYAVHLPAWVTFDRIGAVFGALAVAAVAIFLARFLASLVTRTREA
jgi:cytochrome c oxidase subunit 1